MSTIFVLDGEGTIKACVPRFRGESDSRLAKKLEALLAEPAATEETAD
jgi:hypothetical protein